MNLYFMHFIYQLKLVEFHIWMQEICDAANCTFIWIILNPHFVIIPGGFSKNISWRISKEHLLSRILKNISVDPFRCGNTCENGTL